MFLSFRDDRFFLQYFADGVRTFSFPPRGTCPTVFLLDFPGPFLSYMMVAHRTRLTDWINRQVFPVVFGRCEFLPLPIRGCSPFQVVMTSLFEVPPYDCVDNLIDLLRGPDSTFPWSERLESKSLVIKTVPLLMVGCEPFLCRIFVVIPCGFFSVYFPVIRAMRAPTSGRLPEQRRVLQFPREIAFPPVPASTVFFPLLSS